MRETSLVVAKHELAMSVLSHPPHARRSRGALFIHSPEWRKSQRNLAPSATRLENTIREVLSPLAILDRKINDRQVIVRQQPYTNTHIEQ